MPKRGRGAVTSAGSPTPGAPSAISTEAAEELVAYLNRSPTAFHAVDEACKMLDTAGYVRLAEEEAWDSKVRPGGKYYVTRNLSALVAFSVGGKFEAGNGLAVVAAHTDSPCPKLKPVTAREKHGYLEVGVCTYGGGLWHTWFDRDLTVGGRVLVRSAGGGVTHRLVMIDRPIMRIPTLAIHLDRTVNTDGFKLNTEQHLAPVLATCIKGQLDGGAGGEGAGGTEKASMGTHHPLLLSLLAEELGCAPDEICDFDLSVCDTQPGVVGGAAKEFIYSGRLDNLASTWCAVRSMVDSDNTLEGESMCRGVALFDHEEVGSNSAMGAGSPMMMEVLRRVTSIVAKQQGADGNEGLVERAVRRSFLVSADMAHALHPNYPERHEEYHQPRMHKGLVFKTNQQQRYATNSVTAFLFREVATRNGIPTQEFCVRNDAGCGSTIGPIMAAGMGIRTVDVGIPQLSMHSVREMCGTDDIELCLQHFTAFFNEFSEIDGMVPKN